MAAKSSRHILALDGLRGLAVLMVFAYHYGGGASSANHLLRMVGTINSAGWSGVTLFFVLSGFLITGILWDTFDRPHWVRDFYARRALRIFPLYYAILLALLVTGLVEGKFSLALHAVVVFGLFLQNVPGLNHITPILPIYHLWSLAVEEQFYLLWPLLLYRARAGAPEGSVRRALWLCAAVVAVSLAFRGALWAFADPDPWYGFLLSRAGALAVGGALAILFRGERWAEVQRVGPALCLGGVLLFGLGSWHNGGDLQLNSRFQMLFGLSAMTVAYAGLLILSLGESWVARGLGLGWLRWLGRLSYGIYVFHVFLRLVFDRITERLLHVSTGNRFLTVRLVVAAVGTLAAAWLSFTLVEQPFLRVKRSYPRIFREPSELTAKRLNG